MSKKYIIILVVFLIGVFIGHFIIPQNDDCVWDISEDPRGCVIAWDDGTYSWKSQIYNLGTIKAGESKVINLFEQENN
jgi:hypothetical protein